MNWKEQFRDEFHGHLDPDLMKLVESFVSEQLHELIADIPDYEICLQADSEHLTEEVNLRTVKQQLKAKWLERK